MSTLSARMNPTPRMVISTKYLMLLPLFCGWLMMLVTFSIIGRESSAGDVDWIAKCKILVRGFCGGILLISVLWQLNRSSTRFSIRRMAWLGLFLGWAVLSTVWSPMKSISLGQSGSLVILSLMCILIASFWRNKTDTSTIFFSLTASLFLLSVILLLLRFIFPSSGSMQRMGEGLLHATNASSTASLGIVLLLASRLIWRWQWSRYFIIPALPVFIAVLFIASSRTAMALTIIISGILILLYAHRIVIYLFLFGLSGLMVSYLALDPHLELLTSGGDGITSFAMRGQSVKQLSELSGRNELWTIVWNSFLESPWIGHGYFVTSKTGEITVWYRKGNFPAHNIWLQALTTTGVIGLILFAVGLVGTYVKTTVQLGLSRSNRNLSVFLTIFACWYLGWSLTNDSILGPIQPETVVFFTILGVALASLHHQIICRQQGEIL